MKKKIAIIYNGAKRGGGVDTYLKNLLTNQNKAELVLLSLGDSPFLKQFPHDQIKIFSEKRFNPSTVFALKRELTTGNYDLVVTQGVVTNAYGRAAALLAHLPVVTTVHSNEFLDYDNRLITSTYRTIERLTRWKTSRFIVVSGYLKNILIKSGVKEAKITVIYNGTGINEKDIRQKTKIDSQNLKIGSIGRLHHIKNFDSLILAIKKFPHAELFIAGEGDERAGLKKLIKKENLGSRVKLVGRISEINSFLSGLDIYVQPSFSEGFGLTVIEAMQAGLPVVVAPGGALPELISDGKTGIIAGGFGPENLAEAIKRLVNDQKLRQQVAAAGQQEATEGYNVKNFAEETVDVYLGVAK